MKESNVHYQVAQYLKIQYPQVIFRTDFAAGIRMTMGQAMKHKSLQSSRAYPDIFIAKPKLFPPLLVDVAQIPQQEFSERMKFGLIQRGADSLPYYTDPQFCGLYIELKREGTVLTRPKDANKILKGETKLRYKGQWFDQHIEEQAEMLERLRQLGYEAKFAVGFEEAKNVIDNYLR